MSSITFLGHAAVLIKGSKTILIDPFFTNNPQAALGMEKLPNIDFILPTHDHFDHLGDAIAIAKKHNATIIAIHEITQLPAVLASKIKTVGMNIGGTYKVDGVAISMTQAVHSSTAGSPCGFVIEMDDKRIYHAGDTAFFSDMSLIPKLFGKLDIAFLPIGGHYVMDIKQAAMAAKLLKPKLAVPIHYNTWPVIQADPEEFAALAKSIKVKILSPGTTLEL